MFRDQSSNRGSSSNERYADIEIKARKKMAFRAAEIGDSKLLRKWLTIDIQNIYIENSQGFTVIEILATNGHAEAIVNLLNNHNLDGSISQTVAASSALTDDVKTAIKKIKFKSFINPETNIIYKLDDMLRDSMTFADGPISPRRNMLHILTAMIEFDPSVLQAEIKYTKNNGKDVALDPLRFALKHCSAEIVDLLISKGKKQLSENALLMAACNTEVVDYLIKNQGLGKNPLENAAALSKLLSSSMSNTDKLKRIETYLALDIDWSYTNKHGESLLDVALNECPEALPRLCKMPNVSINMRNKAGMTPMMVVASGERAHFKQMDAARELIKLKILINMGADPTLRAPDEQRQTALEMAFCNEKHILAYHLAQYIQIFEKKNNQTSLNAQLTVIKSYEAKIISETLVAPFETELNSSTNELVIMLLSSITIYKNKLENIILDIESLSSLIGISSVKLNENLNNEAVLMFKGQEETLKKVEEQIREISRSSDEIKRARDLIHVINNYHLIIKSSYNGAEKAQELIHKIECLLQRLSRFESESESESNYLKRMMAAREAVEQHAVELAKLLGSPADAMRLFQGKKVKGKYEPFDEIVNIAEQELLSDIVYDMALDCVLNAMRVMCGVKLTFDEISDIRVEVSFLKTPKISYESCQALVNPVVIRYNLLSARDAGTDSSDDQFSYLNSTSSSSSTSTSTSTSSSSVSLSIKSSLFSDTASSSGSGSSSTSSDSVYDSSSCSDQDMSLNAFLMYK